MVAVSVGSSANRKDANSATNELNSLGRFTKTNMHSSEMLALCSLQRGAVIGEECLYPESRYFYSVVVKSSNATFLVLNKTTTRAELENPTMQLSINLQRRFLQKKYY